MPPNSLLNIVLRNTGGSMTAANLTGAAISTFAWKPYDDQIADTLTNICNSMNNAAPAVMPANISRPGKATGAERSLRR